MKFNTAKAKLDGNNSICKAVHDRVMELGLYHLESLIFGLETTGKTPNFIWSLYLELIDNDVT